MNCAGTQGPAVTFVGRFDASADTLLVGASSSGVTSIPFQPILDMPLHGNRGTTVRARLTTRPSAAASLFVDPSPGGILWIPGLDAPFVLSVGAAPILGLSTSTGGTGTFDIGLPLDPVFRHLDLSFQVATAAAATPTFRLSNLGVLRVHRRDRLSIPRNSFVPGARAKLAPGAVVPPPGVVGSPSDARTTT